MQRKRIALFFLIALSCAGCSKNDDDENCVAGTGGDLTIVAKLQHHGKSIIGQQNYPDTVFLKYNTQDKPADDKYDAFIAGNPGEDHVHLTNLKCGKYYLLAVGFDTSISQRVVGGIPFSTDKTSGETEIIIPVTESH